MRRLPKARCGDDNPNFGKMIIIGHTMGGILTSLMTKSSEGKKLPNMLLKMISVEKSFDELDLSPSERSFFEESMIFEPLPFVKRTIFIATPHKGSEVAKWKVSKFGSSLVTLPFAVVGKTKNAFRKISSHIRSDANRLETFTSIDNLDPDSIFIKSFNELLINKTVKRHSIIGDESGDGGKEGSDGVVPYWSSHIEGVESELIIKSGHNVQVTPECSKEIRRIIIEHLSSEK
ncbi:MAG TPA: hypothetical protein PK821_07320 [Victivallales bacterium]|nr:hypothetical protein [Victivallales bacterium]